MDKESFIDALNEDLRTECQSIVHCISHVATVTGAEFLSVIDELKVHLTPGALPRVDPCGADRVRRGYV